METTKSRMQNVHGCKETCEPGKLYHEEQKITELEIEEIKKEFQGSQRSHLNEREEEEQSEQLQSSSLVAGLDRPLGFQEVEAPRFLDNRHLKVVRLLALRTNQSNCIP
jgi:murein tripeptide amidase MpaA